MIIVSTTILSFSFKVWVDLYVPHEIIFRIGNKQSSLMFAFLFFLQIVLRYHHACCLGMIDLGVLCLGLFFDKLCATFSGMDKICVHKTTVWKGLLDHKKWMISYRQVVKPATPNNLSNIVANEEKNHTNIISWQDQCCLFALICFLSRKVRGYCIPLSPLTNIVFSGVLSWISEYPSLTDLDFRLVSSTSSYSHSFTQSLNVS